MNKQTPIIAVIGLGYVGLPLAVEFAKKYPVVSFDVKKQRVTKLREGHDVTREIIDDEALQEVLETDIQTLMNDHESGLLVSDDISHIKDCNT